MQQMNGAAILRPAQQPVMNIAAPINDAQLIALAASNLVVGDNIVEAEAAVKLAVEIVAQSIIACQPGGLLQKRVEAIQAG